MQRYVVERTFSRLQRPCRVRPSYERGIDLHDGIATLAFKWLGRLVLNQLQGNDAPEVPAGQTLRVKRDLRLAVQGRVEVRTACN